MGIQTRRVALVIFAMLISLLGPPPAAGAGTFTVNSPIDAVDLAAGDGLCATAAGQCTLRAAVQESNASPGAHTIILPSGTYMLTLAGRGEDLAATGDLDVTSTLTISGAGSATTVIDGGGIDRLFHVLAGGSLQITQLTLRSGATAPCPPPPAVTCPDGQGGAIHNAGGAVTLTNVVLTANTATSSGTIFNAAGSTLTIQDSSLNGNTASFGGGLYNDGTATIVGSIIDGNTSASGGGLYAHLGVVTVSNSTISNNSSSSPSSGGGGVRLLGGTATILGSLLTGNMAVKNGGAINNSTVNNGGGALTLANTTVSGNSASGSGGGLYANGGTTTLSNVTLANNSAVAGAGGVHVGAGAVTARNSIVAGNGTNCSGAITSQGYNLDSGAACSFAATGDLQNANVGLGPLQSNGGATRTVALLSGSAAIDAGSPTAPGSGGAACEASDQRGAARPTDGNGDGVARCDIGAFEAPQFFVPTPMPALPAVFFVIPTATPLPTPTPTATAAPLPRAAPPALSEETAAPQIEAAPDTSPPETWLIVLDSSVLYSADREPVGVAEPGERYRVVLGGDGWWRVVSQGDPDYRFWIEDGPSVAITEPGPQDQPEAGP